MLLPCARQLGCIIPTCPTLGCMAFHVQPHKALDSCASPQRYGVLQLLCGILGELYFVHQRLEGRMDGWRMRHTDALRAGCHVHEAHLHTAIMHQCKWHKSTESGQLQGTCSGLLGIWNPTVIHDSMRPASYTFTLTCRAMSVCVCPCNCRMQ